jgi:predicted dithiol-disulfide oxidoreductase (DUF899 family)
VTAQRVGSRDEWLAARLELLIREKDLNRLRDSLAAERRALPWVPVEKDYRFDGLDGSRSLAELFDGRGQLLVYHFMFGPDWDEGCPSCSFWADTFEGLDVHLAHRDVTFTCVSRAPYERLAAPGISAFAVDDGAVFHTYSSYSRGLDPLNGAYQLLDLTPSGRDEGSFEWPMAWLRRHDAYGD